MDTSGKVHYHDPIAFLPSPWLGSCRAGYGRICTIGRQLDASQVTFHNFVSPFQHLHCAPTCHMPTYLTVV